MLAQTSIGMESYLILTPISVNISFVAAQNRNTTISFQERQKSDEAWPQSIKMSEPLEATAMDFTPCVCP